MEARLKIIMRWVVAIWIVTQIVLIIVFWGKPLNMDPAVYINLAQECFNNGTWYPMETHIYASYIWAPGFVNFLILQLKLFGTVNLNAVLNLLMNIGILGNIYYLGSRFFSVRVAALSVIIYCLLYSNLMIVVPACTEIPFLFLALSGFCLGLSNKTWHIVFGGVLVALANWVRPLSIIFILILLLYWLFRKSNIKSYVAFLVPLLLVVFIIGFTTYNRIGYYVYQSTTSGFNMVQTANDKAYGGVMPGELFKDSTTTLYIKNGASMTFVEKDSIWRARAYDWIKAHPVRYIGLFFKKMGGMYLEDSWPDKPIFGGNGVFSMYESGKMPKAEFMRSVLKMGLKSAVYYVVLLLFILSLYVNRKVLLSEKGMLLLLLVIGTCSNCLLIVSSRYHYTYLFVIVLFAASFVDYYLVLRQKLSLIHI